jgi:hypothetical protein
MEALVVPRVERLVCRESERERRRDIHLAGLVVDKAGDGACDVVDRKLELRTVEDAARLD